MNESNAALEALKIITDFLSKNSRIIAFVVLVFIFRNALSNLISRLTSFSMKNGDSTFGVEAASPFNAKELVKEIPGADEKPPIEVKDSKVDKIEVKEGEWFSEMYNAFLEERFDDAEVVFKKYSLSEKDDNEIESIKAFYLRLRFEKAKDNRAIDELADLARTAKTEESRFNALTWLSYCLDESMQYGKKIKLWQSAFEEAKSESRKTIALVNLAYALDKDDKAIEAHRLLVDRLSAVDTDEQKSSLYQALSVIEKTLGNTSLSIYTQDKSLEYDPHNRDELFNSAYAASNENFDEISISNYIKLIRIDENNAIALNNLGVRAQEAGFKVKAVENYKKSSSLNNTLAMANQGYLLLNAGFSDEAAAIANKALELSDPHQNVNSLVARVNAVKQEEEKDWDQLQKKSLSRQKIIRMYTQQYYLGSSNSLKGDWLVNGSIPTALAIDNNIITASWTEPAGALGGTIFKVELQGKVSGSAFNGVYTRKKDDNSQNTLLGFSSNTTQSCIGCISDDGNKINIVSTKLNDDFSLFFLRPNS